MAGVGCPRVVRGWWEGLQQALIAERVEPTVSKHDMIKHANR